MIQRTLSLNHGWLHLPIGRNVPCHYVRFFVDGEPFAELHLGLSGKPDFYCGMELTRWVGHEITLSTDDGCEALLDGILEGAAMDADNPLYPDLYREALRPQYHFSSKRGWLNDPNGLFFDGEKYHLYYQHNPYGIVHGGVNIHWGHAVSPDGVQWKELPDGVRPWTCAGHIASGSCIIDTEGVAGYGRGAVIAAFTHLGSRDFHQADGVYPSQGQFLAYSTDGGDHFTLFPDNPAIPTLDGNPWRDPRIFAHPDGGFGMAVYETDETGDCVAFYHSDDLHHWARTARAQNLYECPDLFELTPVNDKAPRWVLYGADGMYRIGDFKDGAFHQVGDRLPMDFGKCTYAGQTWNNRDDADGRMHISWLRDESLSWDNHESYPGMPFSQCMTVACLLTLVSTPDGYRLNRNPVPAVAELRCGEVVNVSIDASESASFLPHLCGDALLQIDAAQPIEIKAGNFGFTYDPATGEAVFDGERRFTLQKRGPLNVRILTDRMSCEFFLQEEISASYGLQMQDRPILIESAGSLTVRGESYAMRSIWK